MSLTKVRAYKLEKYMELEIDESLIENKYKFLSGKELSLTPNLFYGLNVNEKQYKMISNVKEFQDYDVVVRLVHWNWHIRDKEGYIIRILKTNKDEKVDFKEEEEYLKCRVVSFF